MYIVFVIYFRISTKEGQNGERLSKFFISLFFILTALFFFQFSFAIGVYAGIYLSQNYDVSVDHTVNNTDNHSLSFCTQVPRVDDPQALIQKIKDFADKHRKD